MNYILASLLILGTFPPRTQTFSETFPTEPYRRDESPSQEELERKRALRRAERRAYERRQEEERIRREEAQPPQPDYLQETEDGVEVWRRVEPVQQETSEQDVPYEFQTESYIVTVDRYRGYSVISLSNGSIYETRGTNVAIPPNSLIQIYSRTINGLTEYQLRLRRMTYKVEKIR